MCGSVARKGGRGVSCWHHKQAIHAAVFVLKCFWAASHRFSAAATMCRVALSVGMVPNTSTSTELEKIHSLYFFQFFFFFYLSSSCTFLQTVFIQANSRRGSFPSGVPSGENGTHPTANNTLFLSNHQNYGCVPYGKNETHPIVNNTLFEPNL